MNNKVWNKQIRRRWLYGFFQDYGSSDSIILGWLGFPSFYARKLGWICASTPYPSGFVPFWEVFAWRDFVRLSKMQLEFCAPTEAGLLIEHNGVLARQIDTSDDRLLIYKTEEEKEPYPPEWELVTQEISSGELRRLGYFSKMPKAWKV